MVNHMGTANLIHYGSNRCLRVIWSFIAFELQKLVLVFDFACIIQHLTNQLTGRKIHLDAYVDSKTVFDVIAVNGHTTERRLRIDISALRSSYANGERNTLTWIPEKITAAEALTKITECKDAEIRKTIETHTVNIIPIGWSDSCMGKKKTSGVSTMKLSDGDVRVCKSASERKQRNEEEMKKDDHGVGDKYGHVCNVSLTDL